MSSSVSVNQCFKNFIFELYGVDNDNISFVKIETDDTTDNTTDDTTNITNVKEMCQCFIYYSCQLLSRLSDTYIKYKDE